MERQRANHDQDHAPGLAHHDLDQGKRAGERGDPSGPAARTAASEGKARADHASSDVPAWGVEPRPPQCNTGGKFPTLSIKIDAIRVTLSAGQLAAVEALVTRLLGDQPEDMDHGLYTYKQGKRWPTGAVLLWSDGRPECCLQLMGQDVNTLGLGNVRPFCEGLGRLGAKGRRVDVALDDYSHRLVSVGNFIEAGRARNVQGCRCWEPVERFDVVTGDYLAHGANFGVRGKDGSGRYLRVYRKDLESRGLIDCTRMELETAGDVAELLFSNLLDCPDDEAFAAKLRHVLAGCIDFRERGDERNVDRMPRLSWWSDIVEALGDRIALVAHTHTPALQKTAEYIRSAFSKSLALLRVVLDSSGVVSVGDLLEHWMDEAQDQINWKRLGGRSLSLNLVELTTSRRHSSALALKSRLQLSPPPPYSAPAPASLLGALLPPLDAPSALVFG